MAPPTHPLQEGSFDPLALLRRSRGDSSDIRSIKLRTLWLRQRVPEARVKTKLVTLDERVVVMAAQVSLPDGSKGSGHAATRLDDSSDVADAIETTELRAIGRALDTLGYVVVEDSAPTQPPTPAPSPPAPSQDTSSSQPPGHVRAIRAMRQREQQPPREPSLPDLDESGSDITSSMPPAPQQPSPPADLPRNNQQPPTQIRPPVDDDAEPPLEDVSWTAFWEWARATYQLGSRVQLEEMLGQPVAQKTPGELRRMLIAHFEGANSDQS